MTEQEIRYSDIMINKIREKDPNLQAMADRWEQAFGGKVQVTKDPRGGIIVKKQND